MIIRLGAIMTTIVHSFVTVGSDEPLSIYNTEIHSKKSLKRSGIIPLHAARRVKTLLPKVAVRFLSNALSLFKEGMKGRPSNLIEELSFHFVVGEKERLDNVNRYDTIAFQYSPNGHCYIALNQAGFRKFVSSSNGSVPDCCILHTENLDRSFRTFQAHEELEFIHEIGEEIEPAPTSASPWRDPRHASHCAPNNIPGCYDVDER